MNVSGFQDAGFVECPQQAVGANGYPAVQRVVDVGAAHAARRPSSSRSDSATTIEAGGNQLNTPQGWPSTVGVWGPHIPRTNRYSTPPRCADRLIVRLAPSQESMQHNGIQQRLQKVVRMQHRLESAERSGSRPRWHQACWSCSRPPDSAARATAGRRRSSRTGSRAMTGHRDRRTSAGSCNRPRDRRMTGAREATHRRQRAERPEPNPEHHRHRHPSMEFRSPTRATDPAARFGAMSTPRPTGPRACRAWATMPTPTRRARRRSATTSNASRT